MVLINYDDKSLKKWNVTIPIIYNSEVINDDIHDSWLEFDIKEDIVLNEFTDSITIDMNSARSSVVIKLHKDESKNQIVVIVDGILEVGEIEVFNKIKSIIKNIPIALTLEMNIVNCNIHHYHPKVEFDYDHIVLHSTVINKNSNNTLNYGAGTEIHITMGLNKERLLKIYKCIDKLQDDKMIKFLYNGFGEKDLESKFYNSFAIIEIIEIKYKDYSNSIQIIDDESCDKLKDCVENFPLNNENKKKITDAVIGAAKKVSNMTRNEKLCRIVVNRFNIKSIKFIDKIINIDDSLCNFLIEGRRKLFHGGGVNLKELKLMVDYLILIDIEILKELYFK